MKSGASERCSWNSVGPVRAEGGRSFRTVRMIAPFGNDGSAQAGAASAAAIPRSRSLRVIISCTRPSVIISPMICSKPAGWSGIAIFLAAAAGMAADGGAPMLTVLSGRPDMVSGGDALIEVKLPPGTPASKLEVTLNGRDVTKVFHEDPAR